MVLKNPYAPLLRVRPTLKPKVIYMCSSERNDDYKLPVVLTT
jgi:hypothetical protein